jgi:hypothetical protein
MAAGLIAAGLGLNIAQSLFGGFQLLRGLSQAKKNRRPMQEMPEGIDQNVNQAALYAQQGLPQDVYNRNAGQIDRNMGFGLRQSGDRRGGLVGLGSLVQGANDSYSTLNAQDAQARMANLAQLYQARNQQAQYQDMLFKQNELKPFYEKAQEAQGLQGSGLQNIMGGMRGAGNMVSQQAMYNAYNPMETQMAGQMGGIGEQNNMMNMMQGVWGQGYLNPFDQNANAYKVKSSGMFSSNPYYR